MAASVRTRIFLILLLSGFVGVLSFQLVDIPALIAHIPEAQGKPLPMPMWAIRIVTVLQTTVIVAVAVYVGLVLTPKVGLSAPVVEAIAAGRSAWKPLRPQLVPALLGALLGAGAVSGSWILWKPFLPEPFVREALAFNRLVPPLTRFLYGGIVEELLLRWGIMTFLVWLGWKFVQKERGAPRALCFVSAIVLSAVLFGIGHLSIAIPLAGKATVAIVSYVVVANSAFGLIAGYLYWKKGLEAAVVAHTMTHMFLIYLIKLA